MSPSTVTLVGSPTSAASKVMPRASHQARSFSVPLMDGPSSSPVSSSVTVPVSGQPSARRRATAATKAATPPFMSTAPRPYR